MHEVITGDEVVVIILVLAGNLGVFYCVKQCFNDWRDLHPFQIGVNFLLLLGFILQVLFTVVAVGNSHFYKTLMLWYG